METASQPDTERDAPATPLVVLTLEAEARPIPLPVVTFSIPSTPSRTDERPKKVGNRQERKVCSVIWAAILDCKVTTGNPGSKRHTRYVNGTVVIMVVLIATSCESGPLLFDSLGQ